MKHNSLVRTLNKHGLKIEKIDNRFQVDTPTSIGTWYQQDDDAVCVSTLSRSVADMHDPLNDCNLKSYHRTIKGFLACLKL
jgi:hypothetical protein